MLSGQGDPGGPCRACPHSVWYDYTDQDGKERRAVDCQDRWFVFFKEPSRMVPSYIDLPGSFRRSLQGYRNELFKNGCRSWQVVSDIKLVTTSDQKTNLKCDVVALINSEDQEVVDVVGAMKGCIDQLFTEWGQFHLGYVKQRNEEEYSYDPDGNVNVRKEVGNEQVVNSHTGEIIDEKPPEDPFAAAPELEQTQTAVAEPEPEKPLSKIEQMKRAREASRSQ